jgi:uncharacterized protein YgbK (DUF1537 family)
LRGHIKEELKCTYHSAIESANYDVMVIAAAFADAGRITANGKQFIDGISICESIYTKDPDLPASISNITDLINSLKPQHNVMNENKIRKSRRNNGVDSYKYLKH